MSDSDEETSSDRGLRDIEDCRPSIREWCRDQRNPGRTERTIGKYQRDLQWYDEWLDTQGVDDPRDLTKRQANRLGHDLVEKHNGATAYDRWARIKKYYDELVIYDEIESNPLGWWHDDRKERFGMTRTSKRSQVLKKKGEKEALNQKEVRTLEQRVNYPEKRNQLIIRLLWQTGLRRGELAGLRWDEDWERDFEDDEDWDDPDCDFDAENRLIRVREANSKTGTKRIVAYQHNCEELVDHWVDIGRDDALKDDKGDPGTLLVGINGDRLSGDAINNAVKRAADRADIQTYLYTDENGGTRDRIIAHALRHGLGHHLVHKSNGGDGVDIYKVSKILGHASVDITEDIYVGHEPTAGLRELQQHGPE